MAPSDLKRIDLAGVLRILRAHTFGMLDLRGYDMRGVVFKAPEIMRVFESISRNLERNIAIDGKFIDMSGSDISGCDMSGLHLIAANLEGIKAVKTNFSGCLLTDAIFEGAHLEGADFSGASMKYARFHGANVHQAKFDNVDTGSIRGMDVRFTLHSQDHWDKRLNSDK